MFSGFLSCTVLKAWIFDCEQKSWVLTGKRRSIITVPAFMELPVWEEHRQSSNCTQMELPVWEEHRQSSNCTQINEKQQLRFVLSRRSRGWDAWPDGGQERLPRGDAGLAAGRWELKERARWCPGQGPRIQWAQNWQSCRILEHCVQWSIASGAWWWEVKREDKEVRRGMTTQCCVDRVKDFGLTLKEKPLQRGMGQLVCREWAVGYAVFNSCNTCSVAGVHGLCYSSAFGIFLDQGSNSCPCFGRQILNHWANREFPYYDFWNPNATI